MIAKKRLSKQQVQTANVKMYGDINHKDTDRAGMSMS